MACASLSLSCCLEKPEEAGMRRSVSEPVLRHSAAVKLKTSPSVDCCVEMEPRARVNWVERVVELRREWRDRKVEDEGLCEASYEDFSGGESGVEEEFDVGSFKDFLVEVPWITTKLLSKLSFLCNMAYFIPDLKVEDLKNLYGLDMVTSSLRKKAEAIAIGENVKIGKDDSIFVAKERTHYAKDSHGKRRPSLAYQIAASAASYVHSRAKGLISVSKEERHYKSQVAAKMAASTMTTVVAVEEKAKQKAAMGLRSLHSSPCEWFVCDDSTTCTRCFVIQGSDSLASWQTNLFFEPTKFEETNSLVHRGIYEAAKGIYEQFMPEILSHLEQHGEKAKFRFTGHSLGGSLSLLVSMMLLARGLFDQTKLLPVVTFGSPFVFCGGRRALEEVGFIEDKVYSVMMHRDIVPRAFSCNYPNHVAQILKRLNASFRSHPCLNREKVLYSPMGKLFIIQPEEKSSPSHPFLPTGSGLYSLDHAHPGLDVALNAFINSPHPLETLSDSKAYGSDGTVLRDHDSTNYLKAINGLLRQSTKSVVRKSRMARLERWWPILTVDHHLDRQMNNRVSMAIEEVVTGV